MMLLAVIFSERKAKAEMFSFLLFLLFTVLTVGGGYAAMKLFSAGRAILGVLAAGGTLYLGWLAVHAAFNSWLFWVLAIAGGGTILYRKVKKNHTYAVEASNQPTQRQLKKAAQQTAFDVAAGMRQSAKKVKSQRL